MAVGRAEILRLSELRRAIHAALSAPGRQVRLILEPTAAEVGKKIAGKRAIKAVYAGTEVRRSNARIRHDPPDPVIQIDPPIWSYEDPEFISLRRARKWKGVHADGQERFVDEVRVVCPHKRHSLPDAVWTAEKRQGKIWTSGSLYLNSVGEPGGQATGLYRWRGDGPTGLDGLLALEGCAKDYQCPEHPEAKLEDYPVVHGFARTFVFFSSTSKMSTLSWSLPAGPSQMGGTCPGARSMAGMVGTPLDDPDKRTTVKAYKGSVRLIDSVVGVDMAAEQAAIDPIVMTPDGPVILPPEGGDVQVQVGSTKKTRPAYSLRGLLDAGAEFSFTTKNLRSTNICDACYALKGNYGNLTTQMAAALRLFWLEYSLGKVWNADAGAAGFTGSPTPDRLRETAVTMVQALGVAFSHTTTRASEDHSLRHFRVHDSADFAAPYMIDLWGMVAVSFPEVLFWFPTRVWFLPKFRARLQRWVTCLPNLTIRPSALRFGEPAPEAATQAVLRDYPLAGSGAGVDGKDAQWECPAFMAREATCRNSVNPRGWAHLVDEHGIDPMEIMRQEAWTQDEIDAYETGNALSSWLVQRPRRKGGKIRAKLGKRTPEYERILRREFPQGLECRVCWGGLNPGPGPASNADFGGVTVTYHEH